LDADDWHQRDANVVGIPSDIDGYTAYQCGIDKVDGLIDDIGPDLEVDGIDEVVQGVLEVVEVGRGDGVQPNQKQIRHIYGLPVLWVVLYYITVRLKWVNKVGTRRKWRESVKR